MWTSLLYVDGILEDFRTGFLEKREAVRASEDWGAPIRGPQQCIYCGLHSSDAYMVQDEVWRSARFAEGLCHLYCLEKQVGRLLCLDDFTEAPINHGLRFGFLRGMRSALES